MTAKNLVDEYENNFLDENNLENLQGTIDQQDIVGISDPKLDAKYGTSVKAGIPKKRENAIKIFAEARGISPKKYGIDREGDIVYFDDKLNKFVKEISDIKDDPLSYGSFVVPDVLEMIPGILTGVGTAAKSIPGPGGLLTSTAATSLADMSSNAVRQLLSGQMTDEDFSKGDVATTGILSALFQGVPLFVSNKLAKLKNVPDVDQLNETEFKKILDLAKAQNISLTTAEATQLKSLLDSQKVLSNIPQSANLLNAFYKQRQKDVDKAVTKYIESIGQVPDSFVAGTNARKAFDDYKKDLISQRFKATNPMYKEAFENANPINVQSVLQSIDKELETAKGSVSNVLNTAKKFLFRQVNSKTVPETRAEAVHNARTEIKKLQDDPKFSTLNTNDQRLLKVIEKQLTDVLVANNPAIKAVDDEYARLSQPLTELTEGVIQKNFMNVNLQAENLSSKIMENQPRIVLDAKKKIQKVNPQAWTDLVTDYFSKKWEEATKINPKQREQNVDAGGVFANLLIGQNSRQRNAIKAALTTTQYQALMDLTKVLQAAASVKKIGSDTEFNRQITKELSQQGLGVFTSLVAFATSPFRTVNEFVMAIGFERNAKQMAQILQDPSRMRELRALRRLTKNKAKFLAGFSQFIADLTDQSLRDED